MLRTVSKLMLGLVAVILAVTVFAGRASAQAPIPNACCTFTVDVAGIPAACLPVKLTTRWSGGLQTDVINANGVFALPITFAPCPPSPAQFAWASLDGGITLAWYNFPAKFSIGPCCYLVRIGVDAANCIIIYIRPC